MIIRFLSHVFPLVSKELEHWIAKAEQIPDPELRVQALASIRSKKFHAQGGSIYALYPQNDLPGAVRFIVALQTISDYLDNLCDRAGVMDETAFSQLHLAMGDAIDPARRLADYYRYYPFKNDRGYLEQLVTTCRQQLKRQPSYHLVMPEIAKYVKHYSELQSYKHLTLKKRENRLRVWAQQNLDPTNPIFWWEYAAATGSTLGIFLLYAASANPTLKPRLVTAIDRAYFPWVTGLHILLDYFIDAREDSEMGDYNFTSNYRNSSECRDRLAYFLNQSIRACQELPNPSFHLTIIRGLLAMYLSDPKALNPENKALSLELVRYAGAKCRLYHHCCKLLRKLKVI
ncbi:MAG: tetraprenyl-beta-curcumene synthase family protein [Bacteroidota bacterium]